MWHHLCCLRKKPRWKKAKPKGVGGVGGGQNTGDTSAPTTPAVRSVPGFLVPWPDMPSSLTPISLWFLPQLRGLVNHRSHSLEEPPHRLRAGLSRCRAGAEGSQEEGPPKPCRLSGPLATRTHIVAGQTQASLPKGTGPVSALLLAPLQGGEGRRLAWGKKRVQRAHPTPQRTRKSGACQRPGSLDV